MGRITFLVGCFWPPDTLSSLTGVLKLHWDLGDCCRRRLKGDTEILTPRVPFFLISRVRYTHNGKAEDPPAVTQGGCNWDAALNCPLEESLTLPLRQTRRLTPPGQAKTCLPGYSHYTVIWFRKQTRTTGPFGSKKKKMKGKYYKPESMPHISETQNTGVFCNWKGNRQ